MDRVSNACTLFFLLAVATSSPAAAGKQLPAHTGFFACYGIGYGSCRVHFAQADEIRGDRTQYREGNLSQNLNLGVALGNKLLVGIELQSFTANFDFAWTNFANVAAVLCYYPASEIFVRAGPALALLSSGGGGFIESGGSTHSGLGFSAGLGLEHRLTKRLAVVPSLHWNYQHFEGMSTNTVSLTVDLGLFW